MKKLDISHIATGVAMPMKSGSLQFIQQAAQEAVDGLFHALVPNPIANKIYIISGVRNSSTGITYTIDSGVAYLNGEIFDVDATSFSTVSATTFAYATIVTTQFVGNGVNADPVNFTDGSQDNVHDIRKLSFIASATPPGTIPTNPKYEDIIIIQPAWRIGDVKMMACTQKFIDDNFFYQISPPSQFHGLGINEMVGWARCNGNNGTVLLAGRVPAGYATNDAKYGAIGAYFGSEEEFIYPNQLPPHTHGYSKPSIITNNGDTGSSRDTVNNIEATATTAENVTTGQPISHLQPTTVVLFVQKIS